MGLTGGTGQPGQARRAAACLGAAALLGFSGAQWTAPASCQRPCPHASVLPASRLLRGGTASAWALCFTCRSSSVEPRHSISSEAAMGSAPAGIRRGWGGWVGGGHRPAPYSVLKLGRGGLRHTSAPLTSTVSSSRAPPPRAHTLVARPRHRHSRPLEPAERPLLHAHP